MAQKTGTTSEAVRISPPNFKTAIFRIVGTAMLVTNKFSEEGRNQMREKQEAGSQQGKKGSAKPPKDFKAAAAASAHYSTEGWIGMPCGAMRKAMIDSCRLTAQKMTMAKMAIFIEADGADRDEGTPLIRIIGEPRHDERLVKQGMTVDLRARTVIDKWEAEVRVKYDADIFDSASIANLMLRAGAQVGWGAGRPFSSNSAGMGWGTWTFSGAK